MVLGSKGSHQQPLCELPPSADTPTRTAAVPWAHRLHRLRLHTWRHLGGRGWYTDTPWTTRFCAEEIVFLMFFCEGLSKTSWPHFLKQTSWRVKNGFTMTPGFDEICLSIWWNQQLWSSMTPELTSLHSLIHYYTDNAVDGSDIYQIYQSPPANSKTLQILG